MGLFSSGEKSGPPQESNSSTLVPAPVPPAFPRGSQGSGLSQGWESEGVAGVRAQSGFGERPATPSPAALSRAAPGVGGGGVVWGTSRLQQGLQAVPWVSLSPLRGENPNAGVPEEGSQSPRNSVAGSPGLA